MAKHAPGAYCMKVRKGKHRSKKAGLECVRTYSDGSTRFLSKGNINCPAACGGPKFKD
jgi:hypothetical protein